MAGLTLASPSAERGVYSPWRETWRRYSRHKLAVVSAFLLLVLIVAVVFGPFIWRVKINDIDVLAGMQGPSLAHPFGTDDQPGMVHAPAGERLGQLPLGRRVADQRARLARVREALEAVGLGQRLIVLRCRRARHQGAACSRRRSTSAQISAAVTSGALPPSTNTQRCGSAVAMER